MARRQGLLDNDQVKVRALSGQRQPCAALGRSVPGGGGGGFSGCGLL